MIEHVNEVQVLRPARAMLLTIREGRVWLTRGGELDDHVLGVGERLAVEPGQTLYVEPWRRGEAAQLEWQALPPHPMAGAVRQQSAEMLRRLASGLHVLAAHVDGRVNRRALTA